MPHEVAPWRYRLISTVTRWYPFLSGCGRLGNSSVIAKLAGPASESPVWARTHGMGIQVPLTDFVGRAVYFTGDLDPKLSWLIRRIVRPGDRALDIGANLGLMTLILAKAVGPKGRVHAFEPNPAVADLLAESVQRNVLDQVTLHRCALGEEMGELELRIPSHNAGMGSLRHSHHLSSATRIKVSVRKLAHIAEAAEFSHVRLIKIDVEGFELETLRGAEPWFSKYRPDTIIFESNLGEDGPFEFLRERGYVFYPLSRSMFRVGLRRLKPTQDCKGDGFHDVLAVNASTEAEVLGRLGVRLN